MGCDSSYLIDHVARRPQNSPKLAVRQAGWYEDRRKKIKNENLKFAVTKPCRCVRMHVHVHFEKHEATRWRRTKVEDPNADVGDKHSSKRGCLTPEGEAVLVSQPSVDRVWSG